MDGELYLYCHYFHHISPNSGIFGQKLFFTVTFREVIVFFRFSCIYFCFISISIFYNIEINSSIAKAELINYKLYIVASVQFSVAKVLSLSMQFCMAAGIK